VVLCVAGRFREFSCYLSQSTVSMVRQCAEHGPLRMHWAAIRRRIWSTRGSIGRMAARCSGELYQMWTRRRRGQLTYEVEAPEVIALPASIVLALTLEGIATLAFPSTISASTLAGKQRAV
jgi:hypothetical protein